MSDIFREVEEDVRRERIEKIWKQYGDYFIAGAAVIVLAVGGWQFYKSYHAKQVLRASNDYSAASQRAAVGDPTGAAGDFARLAKEAPGGYAPLSKLEQANALLAAGSVGDAVAIYKQIEQSGDSSLGAVARLRHAWAIADLAPESEVQTLLAPLNDPTSAWKYAAREVLAYSAYHNGDTAKAIAGFKSLASDPGASANLRQRAQAMESFLNAGAGRDSGTVPAPPTPVPTPQQPAAPQPDGTPKP
ncbi:MAG TPA: tetratricopeptide repeat protein [Rhizomicrobium sp.]